MSDLISREDVLAVLNKVIKYGVPDKDGKHSVSAEIVFNFVKDMSPAQEWIPCNERLPDKDGRYLTTNSRIGNWIVDWNIWYNEPKPTWLYNQGVIAWMPLPEPWKGADECSLK